MIWKSIIKYDICDSTNLVSKRIVNEIENAGFYVVHSLRQTNGYGTNGRSWDSNHDNLYFSVIVPKSVVNDLVGRFAISVGVAVATSINDFFKIDKVSVKWPNDVLIENKKVAGILVEIEEEYAIVGIGINLNESPKIDRPTTSIYEYNGKKLNVDESLNVFLNSISLIFEKLMNDNFETIKRQWCLMSNDFNKVRKINDFQGIFSEIGNNGEMILNNGITKKEIFSISQI